MKVSKIPGLGNYGHFIDDLDFNTITEEEWMELGRFHASDLVTILRNTNLPLTRYEGLMYKWGQNKSLSQFNLIKKYNKTSFAEILDMYDRLDIIEKQFIDGSTQVNATEISKNTTINRVSGKKDKNGNPLGLFADGELLWHSNEAAQLCFTPGVALYGKVGMVGTTTSFVTTPDWYQEQTESFRSELDELIIVHEWTPGKISPGIRAEQDTLVRFNQAPINSQPELPLVINSPAGIKGLHFSVNTVKSIKGMTQIESDKIFDYIKKTLFVDKYVYDHWYQQNNDLLLFDNSITLHCRKNSAANRLAYRVSYDMSKISSHRFDRYIQEPFRSRYQNQLNEIEELFNKNPQEAVY